MGLNWKLQCIYGNDITITNFQLSMLNFKDQSASSLTEIDLLKRIRGKSIYSFPVDDDDDSSDI